MNESIVTYDETVSSHVFLFDKFNYVHHAHTCHIIHVKMFICWCSSTSVRTRQIMFTFVFWFWPVSWSARYGRLMSLGQESVFGKFLRIVNKIWMSLSCTYEHISSISIVYCIIVLHVSCLRCLYTQLLRKSFGLISSSRRIGSIRIFNIANQNLSNFTYMILLKSLAVIHRFLLLIIVVTTSLDLSSSSIDIKDIMKNIEM